MDVHYKIQNLVPYKPGLSFSEVKRKYGVQDIVKLASNENPLGTSSHVLRVLEQSLKSVHLYPDGASWDLQTSLSQFHKLKPEEIILGNGSDELFDVLIRVFCEPNEDSILTSKGAFSTYAISAHGARVGVIETPLDKHLGIDLAAISSTLHAQRGNQKIKIVFLPNPNNPTGRLLDTDQLIEFLDGWAHKPDLLIVLDEAYHEYVRHQAYRSGIEIRKKYPQLIVSRTFSKAYGLAGLRVGYFVAPPFVVGLMNRVRRPFNINILAQVAAQAALEDQDFVTQSAIMTWSGLDRIAKELDEYGLQYLPSQGNFVMINAGKPIAELNEFFLRRGVIIRPVDNYGFLTWFRLTIGLPEQMSLVMKLLKQWIEEAGQ